MATTDVRLSGTAAESPSPSSWQRFRRAFVNWLDHSSKSMLLSPTILIVLLLAIFPLIVSLVLSLLRIDLVRGTVQFVGLTNYTQLLFGRDRIRTLGKFDMPTPVGWIVGLVVTVLLAYWVYQYVRTRRITIFGVLLRLIGALLIGGLIWLMVFTLSTTAIPGALVITLVFVFGGVTAQYLLGLGLAMLLVQSIPGKRFFRILFLMPMMVTPVGIGFLFRMLTDAGKGPFAPLWKAAGLANYSWVASGDTARLAILIGDTWQWTPFMFIILLAALEGTSRDQIEAAAVDGANRWQAFRFVIIPQIASVSLTLILIRMIEAFKMIDLPNIMTNGTSGTETLTLFSYIQWKATSLGPSAAIAYLLLFVVTLVAMFYVNIIRQRILSRF